jgi:putative transposase
VIKQVTVSRSVDEWYVSIQTEQEVEVLAPRRAEVVGIDVGVARFATLSDGTTYMPVSAYRKSEKKLAKEQRKLARKQKYSANWRKHVQKVQKLHKCISDKRRDLQHKVSTAICKKHAVVVIEDLNVKGMSASASGTVDNPGTHVGANGNVNCLAGILFLHGEEEVNI